MIYILSPFHRSDLIRGRGTSYIMVTVHESDLTLLDASTLHSKPLRSFSSPAFEAGLRALADAKVPPPYTHAGMHASFCSASTSAAPCNPLDNGMRKGHASRVLSAAQSWFSVRHDVVQDGDFSSLLAGDADIDCSPAPINLYALAEPTGLVWPARDPNPASRNGGDAFIGGERLPCYIFLESIYLFSSLWSIQDLDRGGIREASVSSGGGPWISSPFLSFS